MQANEIELRGKMVLTNLPMLRTLRTIVSLLVIFSIMPQFYSIWLGWKVISLFIPTWLFQRGDDALMATYQRVIVFFFEHCTDATVNFYGDIEVFRKKERVLCISNHQSSTDWIISTVVAARQGCEGNMRFVMKDLLQYVPFYGFYLYQHGCIYIRRGNFNQNKMLECLDYLANKKISSWVVIYPEGTRYDPQSTTLMEKNKKYAEAQGLQPFNNCIVPKSRGFYLILDKLRDNIDAVYSITIMYEDAKKNGKRVRAPAMTDFLKLSKPIVNVHIHRIPISEIPTNEIDVKTWLNTEFLLKDKILAKLYNSGRVDDRPVMTIGEPKAYPYSIWRTLPFTLGWFALSVYIYSQPSWLSPSLYWKWVLAQSLGGYFWFALRPTT